MKVKFLKSWKINNEIYSIVSCYTRDTPPLDLCIMINDFAFNKDPSASAIVMPYMNFFTFTGHFY